MATENWGAWSDTISVKIWQNLIDNANATISGTKPDWFLQLDYKIRQDNTNGISEINIIDFIFDESHTGNWANGALSVGAKYGDTSKEDSVRHDSQTEIWTIPIDLTIQIIHNNDGSAVLPLQWYANHTSDSNQVPKITEWRTFNITLPALDPRIIDFTIAINYIGTTCISYNITVNKAISQISMSLDNIAWNTTDQQITNSTGGSFDTVITGLSPGTNYSQYIKVKASSDDTWSNIGTISFTTTKYFPAKLSS